MGDGRVFVFLRRVKSGDALEGRGRIHGFGKVFVTFQADGDAEFRLGRSGKSGGNHAQNVTAALHAHAVAQRYFRGHLQRKFDGRAFGERRSGEQEDSAGTEVLSESQTFGPGGGIAQ